MKWILGIIAMVLILFIIVLSVIGVIFIIEVNYKQSNKINFIETSNDTIQDIEDNITIDSIGGIYFTPSEREGSYIYNIKVYVKEGVTYPYSDQVEFNALNYKIKANSYNKHYLYLEQKESFIQQIFIGDTFYLKEVIDNFSYAIDIADLDSYNIIPINTDTMNANNY